uniref:Uncharacterized protein n=1 Tax=Romanomermis culicivorax TaxID=13658 RepID=A0A915K5N7_ROMCU
MLRRHRDSIHRQKRVKLWRAPDRGYVCRNNHFCHIYHFKIEYSYLRTEETPTLKLFDSLHRKQFYKLKRQIKFAESNGAILISISLFVISLLMGKERSISPTLQARIVSMKNDAGFSKKKDC